MRKAVILFFVTTFVGALLFYHLSRPEEIVGDINLEKELNVKLAKFFPMERVVIDPLSSALGYGMEYSFTIMERVKQIGVIHKDAMAMMPMIADLATETWKTKEAKESKEQGVLWESVTAASLLLAGANLLILRHPEGLKLAKGVVGG